MKRVHFFILVFISSATLLLFSNAQVAPGQPAVKILTPKPGSKLTTNFVDVRYQLQQQAAAASSPNFRVQLDARDPVQTTDTQQNFTGLAPGTHTLTVEVVDANGTPIAGTRSEVQFTMVATPQNPPPGLTQPQATERGRYVPASFRQSDSSQARQSDSPQAAAAAKSGGLPKTGSPLPMLGVIGLGTLLGGLISALRTRPSNQDH